MGGCEILEFQSDQEDFHYRFVTCVFTVRVDHICYREHIRKEINMPQNLKKTLWKLAESLLNATIMLALILVMSSVLLISKAQNFTEVAAQNIVEAIGDARFSEISARLDRLDQASQDMHKISEQLEEGRIDDTQIIGLRSDIQELNANIRSLRQTNADFGLQVGYVLAEQVSSELGQYLHQR